MTLEEQIELCKKDIYIAIKSNNPMYASLCVQRLTALLKKRHEI